MALTTSGQVDWVALTSNTITGSTAILQRLSMANVDPYTLVVAQAVSSHFRMSLLGQRRVHEAVQDLKCFSSLGNAVWFGIGVKHIIRTLAETKEGTMCLTLCASLSEVFGANISAIILGELASVLRLPEGSGPSLPQWEHLVVTCGGTLAATRFPCVAEHLMGLYEGHDGFQNIHNSRRMSEFNDVAQALGGVVEILNGSITSITLVGGAACGWIAAFAHWFLGLDIEVRRGDDEQEILYTSSLDGKVAISVIYDNRGYDMAIKRRDTTYVLRNLESLMAANYPTVNWFSGRVPWDRALVTAFGSQARILIKKKELGMMLGAAASILLAISKADREVSFDDRSSEWPGYGEMSVGFGFLRSACDWLPELHGVSDAAEACVGEPLLLAHATLNNAKNALSNMCTCRNHRSRDLGACLPALGELIIVLVWSLSSLHLETPLQPSLRALRHITLDSEFDITTGPHSFGVWGSWEGSLFSNPRTLTDGFYRKNIRWTAATVLGGDLAFSDRVDEKAFSARVYDESAFTNGGICFYYDILRGLTDRPEAVAVLNVLPGGIQLRGGRIVAALGDMEVVGERTTFQTSQPDNASNVDENTGTDLSQELLIKEFVSNACAYFRLSSSRGKRWYILPTKHIYHVLTTAGQVQCRMERHQEPFTLPTDGVIALDGEGAMGLRPNEHINVSTIVCRLSGTNWRALLLCGILPSVAITEESF